MGKKTKPFIDRKTASTYHLLHRSQRDVGGVLGDDDSNNVSGSAMILWPSPHNRPDVDAKVLKAQQEEASSAAVGPKTALDVWKSPLEQAGFVDEYDYDQHMKPITGSGTFLGAQTAKSSAVAGMLNARSKPLLDPTIQEVSRQLESIALTAECMDEDVAQALFDDFEEGEFEELNDDFVLMAAEEPELEDDEGGQEEFDFDAHIRRLMEKAKSSQKRDAHQVQHDWAMQDDKFFSKAKPLHEHDEEDEEYDEFDEDGFDGDLTSDRRPGVAPKLTTEEERVLCEQFEQALAEYDTDDEEEEDEEGYAAPDEDARGSRPLEGDAQVEAALDDFLQERKDEIFFQGTSQNRRVGGSSFSALVGNKMVPAQDLPNVLQQVDDQDVLPIQVTLESAREILAQPLHPPPPEEILIDGKSYFSERARNPWDCESILSTYSNLDNNPVTIGTTNRRPKKKRQAAAVVEPMATPSTLVQQIMLSKKTGLPLGVLPGKANKADRDVSDQHTMMSVNRGEARNREETAEDKKARKEAIKEERRLARLQKKTMREAFESELRRREEGAIVDSVNGQAVFRIS